MKNAFLRFLGLALLGLAWGNVAQAASFPDVPETHPYYDAIEYVFRHGVVGGYADGSFKPDATINRAELIKILMEAKHPGKAVGEKCFPDVQGEWFAKYVCHAKGLKVVGGYPDGSFQPAKNVTFVEAAKIIGGTFGVNAGADTVWYRPFVLELANKQAIPVSIARFDKEITRGEMAAMIYRIHAEVSYKQSQTFDSLEQQDRTLIKSLGTPVTIKVADLEGSYNTSRGIMTLAQEGAKISGTYEENDGKFVGELNGRVLVGTWLEAPTYAGPNDKGEVYIRFSKDKEKFVAVWKEEGSRLWMQGWTGSKMEEVEEEEEEETTEDMEENTEGEETTVEGETSTETQTQGIEGALTEKVDGVEYVERSTRIGVLLSDDDAVEDMTSGMVYVDKQELALGNGKYLIGLRFQGVNIPQGAIIKTAFIEFRTASKNDGDAVMRYYGEASDSALPFSSDAEDLSTRSRTSAKVVANPAPKFVKDNLRKMSPNMAPILQEIFDRDGWDREQAFVIFVEGTGERKVFSQDAGISAKMNLRYLEPIE